VHPLAKVVDESQYAAFGTLLTMMGCLPVIPLQMIFAQQSALMLATGRERQLARMIRLVWFGTFAIWLVGAITVLAFEKQIVAGWHLPDTTGLRVTMLLLLISIWTPLFTGVLQGRQDFFWMGWSALSSSAGRLAGAAILVLLLSWGAAGMLTGTLLGMAIGVGIGIGRNRDLWSLPGEKFDGKDLVRQALPLLFGFGAFQFLFISDTMFAKAYFSDAQVAQYIAAGTLSRALLWLVMPLATVMFPKLVQASVKSEKSNLFGIVVLATAILAICCGLGLWLVGPLVIKVVYKSAYLGAAKLIPWYAAAMVPLAMTNVMVNDLLARSRFVIVPWMVLLALAYGFTLPWMLHHFPGRIEVILQTLAGFNLLLFGICAWFTWGSKTVAPK
jgi:O-antigen/teichoic acid export membrane protein